MIAIFQNLEDALSFDSAVSAAMGWPNAETKTERYCEPQKHISRNLWAMPVEDYASGLVPLKATLVESLQNDWYPPRP